ncbi:MAG: iron-containing alcohol dehydrogenase [Pseudomonadales bacterium]|nr:iron-containing alcohol dehydrogenase [Halioglobus sp.]MCP5130992.1 iron-containing alcohol dehydrogenase [Pseudomonadales bacterium]
MTYKDLGGNWNFPTSIIAGAGSIAQLADCCRQLGMARPLLVTDPGLAGMEILTGPLADCRRSGLAAGLFSDIKSNPTGQNVCDGIEAYREGGHDGVIAFGGGSAMDAGKAIAFMVGQHGSLWEFEDLGVNWQRADAASIAPVVAVPTTAGTGSEVGRAALITDEERSQKCIIFHPGMLPGRVILDPELTRGLPPAITAATGMDALSHNLEALCSSRYHPLAEGIAIEGIRLVREYLPRAVADGQDMTARMQMIVASSMGATAFQKGLGAMHALAHPLGALYDAHHGLLNAILMPYVLQANRAPIEQRIERLARYIGLPHPGFDGFLDWVLELREGIGIPHSLASIGIDTRRDELVARMAVADPTAATNPVVFTGDQYRELFTRAVAGDL